MAIIYDISTGRAISAPSAAMPEPHAAHPGEYPPDPQLSLATRAHEPEAPCTAYMVLWQRILRDL